MTWQVEVQSWNAADRYSKLPQKMRISDVFFTLVKGVKQKKKLW